MKKNKNNQVKLYINGIEIGGAAKLTVNNSSLPYSKIPKGLPLTETDFKK